MQPTPATWSQKENPKTAVSNVKEECHMIIQHECFIMCQQQPNKQPKACPPYQCNAAHTVVQHKSRNYQPAANIIQTYKHQLLRAKTPTQNKHVSTSSQCLPLPWCRRGGGDHWIQCPGAKLLHHGQKNSVSWPEVHLCGPQLR